ncbi:MAG: hypothetical protein H0W42_05990 [Gemmatimonadaceae bacterium]|nr:hypothetical protein [Gemmatimonadaceae bacterium]
MISEFDARKAARAFVNTHRAGLKVLQIDRQAPVDISSLRVCGRPYFARTTFEPEAARIPRGWQRFYGPWWLIQLCNGTGQPQISLAISALVPGIAVAPDGRIKYDSADAEERFRFRGIPAHLRGLPMAPEDAVSLIAEATGRKVVGVPELILPDREYPQMARWRLVLDSAVSVRLVGTSDLVTTDELFVAVTELFAPPLVETPTSSPAGDAVVKYIPIGVMPTSKGSFILETGRVPRRPGVFERRPALIVKN